MRLSGATGVVPDAAYDDPITDHAIAQRIGRDGHDFATPSGARAATFRMVSQALASSQQSLAKALGGQGTRLVEDVGDDVVDVGQCLVGPDYLRHEYGVGSWWGVPKDFSHSTTRSWGTTLPAARSASAAASAANSASSSSSKMSGSGSAMPYDTRNLSRTNREKPSFWSVA